MYKDTGQLFAAGPEGPLFGRNFDLAEFSWKMGSQPFCTYYTTEQIPSSANSWLAVNLTGYSNAEYDAACRNARLSRSDQSSYLESNLQVQSIFANDLPAIPLYFRLEIAVARPDICGFEMNVSARSDLWNIESLDYGDNCP